MNQLDQNYEGKNAVKVFVEAPALTELRKSILNQFKPFGKQIAFAVARSIDSNLMVKLDDAVNRQPIISGVDAVGAANSFRAEGYEMGSTFMHRMAHMILSANEEIAEQSQAIGRVVLVNTQVENLNEVIAIAKTGNLPDITEISSIIQNVVPEQSVECLVFHYGLRVEDAEAITAKHYIGKELL